MAEQLVHSGFSYSKSPSSGFNTILSIAIFAVCFTLHNSLVRMGNQWTLHRSIITRLRRYGVQFPIGATRTRHHHTPTSPANITYHLINDSDRGIYVFAHQQHPTTVVQAIIPHKAIWTKHASPLIEMDLVPRCQSDFLTG